MENRLLFTIFAIASLACNKSDFLNQNPDQSNIVPTTLSELQAILDNDQVMNGMGTAFGRGPVPHMGEAGADDYYVLQQRYPNVPPQYQNYYTWQYDVYDGEVVNDWNRPYEVIFYSNVVLDGLVKVRKDSLNEIEYDVMFATSLFHRAHAYYQLAQVFAPPYQASTASSTWGLPLRLSSDLGETIERATLGETYSLIIRDLLIAKEALQSTSTIKTRPSKQAALGLLARVYLTMGNYENALSYADSCLQIQSDLLDYNLVNDLLAFPFNDFILSNPEIIFACNMQGASGYSSNRLNARIQSHIYDSYAVGDLRKTIFFNINSGYQFKGDYTGGIGYYYAGISTDEMYLIRAECFARAGNIESAMDDLNTLLEHRWDNTIGFDRLVATSQEQALDWILEERRKELLFRGLRWTDLRRLNLEGRNITLRRTFNGDEYTLPPNDPRYTYPIPHEVMAFHPDWPQNER